MIDDAAMRRHLARITIATSRMETEAKTGCDWNSPLTTGGGWTTGKPEGKMPGIQQCPALTRKLRAILSEAADACEKAARDCEHAVKMAHPHSPKPEPVTSIGGVAIEVVQGQPLSTRSRTVSPEVRRTQAMVKLVEVLLTNGGVIGRGPE